MIEEKLYADQMSNNSGDSQSLWMEVLLPSFLPLVSNLYADVCIVGAGIVGLTCAYTLAKEGKSVIFLDQGHIAGGQSEMGIFFNIFKVRFSLKKTRRNLCEL